MTPNLFLATQKVFSPHKWFKNSRVERPTRRTEHWDHPVPGVYEYIPGRGWYLVATLKDAPTDLSEVPPEGAPISPFQIKNSKEMIKMTPPVPVKYSKVLKRYLLAPDYEMRKKHGKIQDDRGKQVEVGFFQLDDGVAWVQAWDEEGEFIPGPYKLWCIDARTHQFRHMLKGDDPEYVRSHPNSRANSRTNSFEREPDERRRSRSQESRSTQYRTGPGSTRDGPSVPSSRATSIKGLTPSNPSSKPTSQANSRRTSPTRGQRSPGLRMEEAKAALREVAQERAAAEKARAASAENVQRGRSDAHLAAPAT
ncbi:hypothetical protein BU26DRAFT_516886 [Trematosphaeria pertusa]|uniref:Uncharacterized protein n=1 Tax=Trematosphaeria pertusa TaxID=390896 RepID=A0A6A6IRR5_9PLEO|nr:uncharacterized protein BU26DRAFT_516886 [Trematosphaeria pertusa]KAF2252213.1 hypothetical protein BU26DRAFT_516886 [Trematosphaeria pertusa]